MPLDALIADTLGNVRETFDVARYRIELPEELPEVMIDCHCMSRVLVNLLANAEKYSNPGTTIIIRAWRQDPVLVMAVCVEEEEYGLLDRKKLFAPYYRSFRTNTTQGIGLGLHIAKLLVEAQGGESGPTVTASSGTGTVSPCRCVRLKRLRRQNHAPCLSLSASHILHENKGRFANERR